MEIVRVNLLADLHANRNSDEPGEAFIAEIAKGLGSEHLAVLSSEEVDQNQLAVIHVRSGGTEGIFKKIYQKLQEPYLLLADGRQNSLAASLEILTFLQQQGLEGEILHGNPGYIVERLSNISKVVSAKRKLAGMKLGVIGKPSDWLIASDVDYQTAQDLLGVVIEDVPMEELYAQIEQVNLGDIEPETITGLGNVRGEVREGALRIHGALRSLVQKHGYAGVTVRCFDLLGPYHNTGCLGLSLLNDGGIIAGCEGDVASLLSMVVLNLISGEPVFMANPSRIDVAGNELVLAHCTVPLAMTESYSLHTHFESGLGVAVRGKIMEGRATIFKLDGYCSRYFVSGARIQENLSEADLCRTQLRIAMDESVEYFLREPIGNHHIVCRGDHAQLVEEFFRW